MKMAQGFDTIVVGVGAMGAATLWQLAQLGQRVLGLDRWDPPHAWGSTHGDTRLTRCAIGEGEQYVPLVLRSHEIWRALEAETGESLLTQCGALILDGAPEGAVIHGKANFVGRTIAAAERFGIEHAVMRADEVMERFPQFRLRGDEIAYFEPGGGIVRPERCVAAQLGAARRLGAVVKGQTQVVAIEREGGGVCVVTAAGERFRADRAVLAAGMWSPGLISGGGAALQSRMSVTRQVFHWFAPEDQAAFTPERFPAFIWVHGDTAENNFYGFPVPPGTEGVKVGREQCSETTADPDRLQREIGADEGPAVTRFHVAGRLAGLGAVPLRSVVCAYTNTIDGDFLVTELPDNDRVLLVSACSGHGFKHSAGMGEAVAAVVAGETGALAGFGAGRWAA